ncbi:MAG: hypothetical protein JWL90_3808 [Chthoniobacteraceae bacterium]|nr:hypothetical protein [Chthoniobacteraceae bacterium]
MGVMQLFMLHALSLRFVPKRKLEVISAWHLKSTWLATSLRQAAPPIIYKPFTNFTLATFKANKLKKNVLVIL